MAFHTYPVERADALEDESRYRFCSRDELVGHLDDASIVADLGSGTGFYTDDVAPFVDRLYAVDVQAAMHERYREKGIPDAVVPVTAAVGELPFADDSLDAAYSTMTYHEYATPDALADVRGILAPGGRHVVVDWTAVGQGDRGPPLDERFSIEEAVAHHEKAGFSVLVADERPETFVLVARAD